MTLTGSHLPPQTWKPRLSRCGDLPTPHGWHPHAHHSASASGLSSPSHQRECRRCRPPGGPTLTPTLRGQPLQQVAHQPAVPRGGHTAQLPLPRQPVLPLCPCQLPQPLSFSRLWAGALPHQRSEAAPGTHCPTPTASKAKEPGAAPLGKGQVPGARTGSTVPPGPLHPEATALQTPLPLRPRPQAGAPGVRK